jgi:two-component system, NarL family, sensor kinase
MVMSALNSADTEHDQLLRRTRELEILNAIAASLNRSVDLGEALRGALALVAELLGLRAGWVWLLEGADEHEQLAAAQWLPPALRDDPRRMSGSCYCLRTFRDGDLRGAANVSVIECSRLQNVIEGSDGLHYHASIPLYAGAARLGVLNVAHPDWRELTADDLRLLATIGYQIGVAVERARLHARAGELAAAEERARVARELHDSIAQSLSSVALQLEAADALTLDAPHRARDTVREALRQTRAALAETRRVMHELRADGPPVRPLPRALRALADQHQRIHAQRVTVTNLGPAARLTPQIERGLYRIAQEALTNAAKHAAGAAVAIRLAITADHARLTIRDRGAGFDADAAPPARVGEGLGLIGMRERARLLGGVLRVQSAPGTGTRIEVVVPLVGGEPWTVMPEQDASSAC